MSKRIWLRSFLNFIYILQNEQSSRGFFPVLSSRSDLSSGKVVMCISSVSIFSSVCIQSLIYCSSGAVCTLACVCLGVCVWECVHRVILNSWLNSCVFISLYIHLYLYLYTHIYLPVLYSVIKAFPVPFLAPEALVCRIIRKLCCVHI